MSKELEPVVPIFAPFTMDMVNGTKGGALDGPHDLNPRHGRMNLDRG